MTSATQRKRGFAAMDPERMREIASLGGRAAHKEGKAHVFTSEEARKAARASAIVRRMKAQARNSC